MGQAVKNRSRICPLPSGPLIERPNRMSSRTIMAVGLTFMLTTTGLVFYLIQPPIIPIIPIIPKVYTPHAAIAIDGDANFSATALLEGWPGDGSPEDPFIIDGLEIDLGGEYGHCIRIDNTKVSFTIRNCNLTGASLVHTLGGWHAAGIFLISVTNGELVNNICSSNLNGVLLFGSDSNTVANNTCNINAHGIYLYKSYSNTVVNNTCNSNEYGIYLEKYSCESNSNIVTNNTCNSNDIGIKIIESRYNKVTTNTCNSNRIGIYLGDTCGWSNIIADNTFSGNTEHDIFDESEFSEEYVPGEFNPIIFLPIGLAGIIMLVAAWRMVKLSRPESRGE